MLKKLKIRTNKKTEMLDITDNVKEVLAGSGVESGLCFVFVPHTTAGVTINENADPAVKHDILMETSKFVPERDGDYRHAEGNSPGHVKSSLFGSDVAIIVENGKLVLGTWQGVFFCEFDGPRRRKAYVKVIGD